MTERCIPENTAHSTDVPHLRGQLILRLPGGGEVDLGPLNVPIRVNVGTAAPGLVKRDAEVKVTARRALTAAGATGDANTPEPLPCGCENPLNAVHLLDH